MEKVIESKVCQECEATFQRKKEGWTTWLNRRFCSNKCRLKGIKKNQTQLLSGKQYGQTRAFQGRERY